jgi:hypothetical protein
VREEIDIVDRLSISWTSMTEMGNSERSEAAKEIWRLRGDLGELAQKILELTVERDEARMKAMMFLAEKDFDPFHPPSLFIHEKRAKEYAKKFGWDCFKEKAE